MPEHKSAAKRKCMAIIDKWDCSAREYEHVGYMVLLWAPLWTVFSYGHGAHNLDSGQYPTLGAAWRSVWRRLKMGLEPCGYDECEICDEDRYRLEQPDA